MNDQRYEDLKSEIDSFREHYAGQVESLQERISELEEKIESEENSTSKPLEEFVEIVGPENHQQCAIAIGYYQDVKKDQKFSLKDISEGFLECRWSDYSNMRMLKSQLLNEKKWMREYRENEDGETIYILTKEGKEFVEERLDEL